jgi:hypothetical protein
MDNPFQGPARRHQFFESEAVDQLVTMVLELASEVWTVRERLYVLEQAAGQLGLPLREAVDAYKATPQQATELDAMRERMIGELLRTTACSQRKG